MTDLQIQTVEIAGAREVLPAIATFYGDTFGLPTRAEDDSVDITIGHSTLRFVPSDGDPFYHFALLVPGNQFEAAYDWLSKRTTILDDKVFEFEMWNARACYFHDPAGNIGELIAHKGIAESEQPFSGDALVGISEIGVVCDDRAAAVESLETELGLPLLSGDTDGPDSLGFVGRQAHTLILAAPGRGWLPTGRPAVSHPVRVEVTGGRTGVVDLAASQQIRATQ